jgi:type II secretory pathway component GspD/PulD (secretin)
MKKSLRILRRRLLLIGRLKRMKKLRNLFRLSSATLCIFFVVTGFPASGVSDQNLPKEKGIGVEQNKTGGSEKISHVSVQNNRLSVKLVDAQFGSVIDRVAKKSGFAAVISSNAAQKKISTEFQDVELEKGIVRLLKLMREKNYLIQYDTNGVVSKLEIYAASAVSSGISRPKVPARPPVRRPARVAPASRRPTRSPDVRPATQRSRITRPRPRVRTPSQTIRENVMKSKNENSSRAKKERDEESVEVIPYVPPAGGQSQN